MSISSALTRNERATAAYRAGKGIGPVRSARIQAAWAEQRQIKEVMVFLQSHGVTSTYAVKIFKRYGVRAIAIAIKNNRVAIRHTRLRERLVPDA